MIEFAAAGVNFVTCAEAGVVDIEAATIAKPPKKRTMAATFQSRHSAGQASLESAHFMLRRFLDGG